MSFPGEDVILSHIMVVEDIGRSIDWYRDCLGAALFRQYGTTAVFEVNGAWLVLVTGGPGTPDKPDVIMRTIADPNHVSHSMTMRVKDCRAAYDELRSRGVVFLTKPVESESEVRVFFRDPDGHLFELSQAKGA